MSRHPTRNDLPARTRARIEKLLNERLAEAMDLSAAAKQAHWNAKGTHFIALHELFDKLHGAVDGHVDSIAERIAALGGQALGTVQAAARGSSLKAYPEALSDGLEHVAALSDRIADFGARVRKSIRKAAELEDDGTADLLTGVSRDLDQYLWFLEVHLQKAR